MTDVETWRPVPTSDREGLAVRDQRYCGRGGTGADGRGREDILLADGVSIAREGLAAGLVDEVVLHVVPKLAGRGSAVRRWRDGSAVRREYRGRGGGASALRGAVIAGGLGWWLAIRLSGGSGRGRAVRVGSRVPVRAFPAPALSSVLPVTPVS
jgi:hypothetical protein